LSTLDFTKLAPPRGETFEALIRLIGERLSMVVEWSGRGADGGRDLIFVETQQGPIKAHPVRWLVSCKDNSDSSRSVNERDVGSVLDKVRQHRCGGFLLATTTTVSTGLKEMLDKLDSAKGGPTQTQVWDRFEITRMLFSNQCASLLLQFFPEHHRKEAVAKLDAAREVVEAHLPRFAIGQVRTHLLPFQEREELLSGSKVWPHDADQQAIIDSLKTTLFYSDLDQVVIEIDGLHFDAFMSFCDTLIRNFPRLAIGFLKAVAKTSTDNGVIYNAIEILRESDDVDLNDELTITRHFDRDTLYDLYHDMVRDDFGSSRTWKRPLGEYISSGELDLGTIGIGELTFKGGQGVSFNAHIEITATASYYDDRPDEEHRFDCNVKGHLDGTGVVIDSTECVSQV
jgi:hypothetical protein